MTDNLVLWAIFLIWLVGAIITGNVCYASVDHDSPEAGSDAVFFGIAWPLVAVILAVGSLIWLTGVPVRMWLRRRDNA